MHFIILIYIIFLQPSYIVLSRRTKRDADEFKKVIEIPLTKIENNFYGKITVGTPKDEWEDEQVFTVNFDTGSQHLWLASAKYCPTPDCFGVDFKAYDGTMSKTYKPTDQSFELQYADETMIKGKLAMDNIQLGTDDNTVLIENQVFGEAEEITGVFENSDGIFGLGLITQNLYPGNPVPPLWAMLKQHNIYEFGLYLNRDSFGDNAGKLTFNGYDPDLVAGPFTPHDVVKVEGVYRGWNIHLDKIIVEQGEDIQEIAGNKMLAMPDSGCGLVTGPKDFIDNLNAAVFKNADFPHTDKYSFFCKALKDHYLPNVTFAMDGIEYKMTSADYKWTMKNKMACRTGFIGVDGSDHIVLGQTFMQTFYTRFDIKNHKVWFAKAKQYD